LTTVDQEVRGMVRAVILVLNLGRNPDAPLLSLLRAFHEGLRDRGIALALCGVRDDMAAALKASGLRDDIGYAPA
jgi:hypothetical protein